MSKMREVAALLGVEIGEEFEITKDHCTYRITEQAMERKADGHSWVTAAGIALHDVLRGKERIIKTPWKPKDGETYWTTTPCACWAEWEGSTKDLSCFAIGNCFKTREEAESHREEIFGRLQKIYDDGKPLMEAT